MTIAWKAIFITVVALLLLPSVTRAESGRISSEVPGIVQTTQPIDAKKLALGAIIQTRLTRTVHFANGTELARGTWLNAIVTQDDMQFVGKVKLALRFTEARMKNGRTVAVRATILDINSLATPVEGNSSILEPAMQVRTNLNNQPDQVNVVDIGSGANLHSDVSSQNSGVLVTNKDDLKLPSGTKLELAFDPNM
jgi:hypothetical protein